MPFRIINKTFLLFLFCFALFEAHAQNPLHHYCHQMNGTISSEYQCPKSRLKLSWDFCVINNRDQTQFFDGCTGPTGDFEFLLTPACIKHDLCYHHEPATNGKTQEDCDEEFRLNLFYSCYKLNDHKEVNKCLSLSVAMYLAVRTAGVFAFHCDNTALK